MAESSYPLRRLHRLPESRQRIEAAFALLRETKDYPAQQIEPESEVVVVLRAQADYESQVGDRHRAGPIWPKSGWGNRADQGFTHNEKMDVDE